MSTDMNCPPYRWAWSFRIFNNNRVSLYARVSLFFTTHLSFYFLSSTNNEVLIINSSLCPDFSSTFAVEGELVVVIVVQFLQHVYKTNVLSNSHACFRRPYRCCCRKQPNQDDSEEVIVVELQVLFRHTKVFSNSHPC